MRSAAEPNRQRRSQQWAKDGFFAIVNARRSPTVPIAPLGSPSSHQKRLDQRILVRRNLSSSWINREVKEASVICAVTELREISGRDAVTFYCTSRFENRNDGVAKLPKRLQLARLQSDRIRARLRLTKCHFAASNENCRSNCDRA